jgi:branched-chain amino acid transport system ATP-binding protein
MPILSVNHLSLTIQGNTILNNVSFTVEKGDVVGLIGPNGSGKTTLFNVLSGFLMPTAGIITYNGDDITRLSPALRARSGIGRVFQNFGIFREMTLEENVLVALEALPKEQRAVLGDMKSAVKGTLELVGLSDHAKKKAGSLSGGQMRLLEIARTLKSGKELFLLDEPTAGVSPKMTHQVADLISLYRTHLRQRDCHGCRKNRAGRTSARCEEKQRASRIILRSRSDNVMSRAVRIRLNPQLLS